MSESLYLASTNSGKRAEFAALLEAYGIDLASTFAGPEVEESADDYLGNARLKARALHATCRANGIVVAVLADDSGLEVDALGGAPGIYSARFGGTEITWPQRRALLLERLSAERAPRAARFVCALVIIEEDGRESTGLGEVRGRILEAPGDGAYGFGYDALFAPNEEHRSFAQIGAEEKALYSHRSRALAALITARNK
ncbi:MAG TPA: non-canonical purine NTP pyrophosphatase [Candidatus Dormibacteraeota bacterium]|nr:non-canonical purine NTP pyrophosphatase [Candidatus Dormibacteraeota bacterium]